MRALISIIPTVFRALFKIFMDLRRKKKKKPLHTRRPVVYYDNSRVSATEKKKPTKSLYTLDRWSKWVLKTSAACSVRIGITVTVFARRIDRSR